MRKKRLQESALEFEVTDLSYIDKVPNHSRDFRAFKFLNEDSAQPLPELTKNELAKIDMDSCKLFGTMNQIDIYLSGIYAGHHTFVIFDEKTKNPLAFIVVQTQPIMLAGEERTLEVRSWTHPAERGKGYATTLYQFLVKKLELKLVCDDMLSDDAVKMYKQFIAKRKFDNISFYNEKTKQVQDDEPSNLWTMPNQWRIFLESFDSIGGPKPLFGKPGLRHIGESCYDNIGFD